MVFFKHNCEEKLLKSREEAQNKELTRKRTVWEKSTGGKPAPWLT